MVLKFDLHVATEPCEDESLERTLMDLGLKHDRLVEQHVNFYGNIAVSACPLIGLHMSKKYDQNQPSEILSQIRKEIEQIEALLRKHGVIGYAHAEGTHPECDLVLTSKEEFNHCVSWPVARFQPTFSGKDKKWDIHIAIPIDNLPVQLATILEQSGMYSIELLKARNGAGRVFRIYTIQGISSPVEGMLLFDGLVNWFRAAHAPHIEIKMETYIAMVRVGEPTIVPPTIDHVKFLSPQEHTNPLIINIDLHHLMIK